jgi:hypothetical protein
MLTFVLVVAAFIADIAPLQKKVPAPLLGLFVGTTLYTWQKRSFQHWISDRRLARCPWPFRRSGDDGMRRKLDDASDIQCAEQRLHDASEKNTERYGNNDELWVVCKCFLLVQIADQSRRNDDDARDGTRRDKGELATSAERCRQKWAINSTEYALRLGNSGPIGRKPRLPPPCRRAA